MRITAKGAQLRMTVYRADELHPRSARQLHNTLLIIPDSFIDIHISDRLLYTDIQTESARVPGNPIVVDVPVYITNDFEAITADNSKGHVYCGHAVCRQAEVTFLWKTGVLKSETWVQAVAEITAIVREEVELYAHYMRGNAFELVVQYRNTYASGEVWHLLTYLDVCYGPDPAKNGMLAQIAGWPRILSSGVCARMCVAAMQKITEDSKVHSTAVTVD
jgi:hypothetical protein